MVMVTAVRDRRVGECDRLVCHDNLVRLGKELCPQLLAQRIIRLLASSPAGAVVSPELPPVDSAVSFAAGRLCLRRTAAARKHGGARQHTDAKNKSNPSFHVASPL